MDLSIYARMHEVEDVHWWFAARRDIVGEVLRGLRLRRSAKILEAGCGTGGNLALLARFGSVTGVEMDPGAAAMARRRGAARVLEGHLPEAMPRFAGRFDLIVLLDVLEHIDDDLASLAALERLLSPGGKLVITVPAFAFLWGRHDEVHRHKRRYRAAGLRERIARAGLRVRHLSYFNTLLFPAIAGARALERCLGGRAAMDALALPPGFVNRALGAVMGSERHVVARARLPFGVSLLAVAERAGGA